MQTKHDFEFPQDLKVELAPTARIAKEPFFTCQGEGNRLVMEEDTLLGDLGRPKLEFIGNNNTFIMEAGCHVKRGHYRLKGDNMTIHFGAKTTVNGAYILCLEGASVELGEDCMLSYDIEFRTSDAHSILDMETGKRVNPAKSIKLGSHVWVGKGAILMPGVELPSNTIVGTRALVTKVFEEENTILAGVPARTVATGRTWDRRLLEMEDAGS